MRLLLDQIRPTSGSAAVLGLDSRRDSLEIRRRVGFLPGDFALHPRLTGAAMLDFLAELRGGVDRRVRDALAERFGAQLDRPVHELSTGNRQKIGLIQAFMHEPELLILDEPIAGLDPLVQQSFHALLGEVAAEGRTVFLSSHTLSEVERVADRVAILRRGRLVAVDSLETPGGYFGGRLRATSLPRATQAASCSWLSTPSGATTTKPFITREPIIGALACGSSSAASASGPRRTSSPSPIRPTAMLPSSIQPIPPNILRSVRPGSSASCARTRSASSSS